jgi:hypothetical protein
MITIKIEWVNNTSPFLKEIEEKTFENEKEMIDFCSKYYKDIKSIDDKPTYSILQDYINKIDEVER